MSREIEVRAWINIEEWKGHYYSKDKNDYIWFILYQNGWSVVDCNENYLKDDEFVIEEYTGFKDRYGKRIFEGDIVEVGFDECFSDIPSGFKGAVKQIDGAWMVDSGKDGIYLFQEIAQWEIIGNIHTQEATDETDNS